MKPEEELFADFVNECHSDEVEDNHPWETENPYMSKKVEEEYNAETSLK